MVSNPSTSRTALVDAAAFEKDADGALALAGRRVGCDTLRRLAERGPDARDGEFEVFLDQARFEAEDPIAQAAEVAISARVRGAAAGVIGAVDFDHELGCRSREVCDVVAEWNLAAKANAEAAAANCRPQLRFRRREC